MKKGLENTIFLLFAALYVVLGMFALSAFNKWLERKIYKSASTAVNSNMRQWLAQAEAQTLRVLRRYDARVEEQEVEA